MSEVALIIIYNHQFNKNIEILENIYSGRFSNIYHLMPFFTGVKRNVIPVYGNSYYFQGYIAQGFKIFFKKEFKYYFFIADDLFLNPSINEKNYTEYFKLNNHNSFLPGLITIHEVNKYWNRVKEAYRYSQYVAGVEIKNLLPSYDESVEMFKNHGLKLGGLKYEQIHKRYKPSDIYSLKALLNWLLNKFKRIANRNKLYNLQYPLVGAYSDITIVDSATIKLFSHYCGLFASTNLFVELGLPSALVLSSTAIITEKDLNFQGKALWTKQDFELLNRFDNKLNRLIENFPKETLYIHPIKLSNWN